MLLLPQHSVPFGEVFSMARKKLKIPVSEFKSKMLGILAEIEESGDEIVITRRNKMIATVLPFSPDSVVAKPGTLAHLLVEEGDYVSPVADNDWEVLQG